MQYPTLWFNCVAFICQFCKFGGCHPPFSSATLGTLWSIAPECPLFLVAAARTLTLHCLLCWYQSQPPGDLLLEPLAPVVILFTIPGASLQLDWSNTVINYHFVDIYSNRYIPLHTYNLHLRMLMHCTLMYGVMWRSKGLSLALPH